MQPRTAFIELPLPNVANGTSSPVDVPAHEGDFFRPNTSG